MSDNKFQLQKYSNKENLFEIDAPQINSPQNYGRDWVSYGNYGEDDGIRFRDFWRSLSNHKLLILAVVTIITTLVAIQVYRIKPWYTASTVFEIGKENTMVLKSGDMTLNDDSDPDYLVNINTKKLILDSPELSQDVILDQKLEENPRVVEAVKKKSFFSNLFSSESDNAKPELNKGNASAKTEPDKTESLESRRVLTDEERLRLAPYVEYLQKNTSVEQVKNARALRVSVTNEDPVLAASIANSIGQNFMRRSFEKQTERFTSSADWLNTSTRELKAKVEAAEAALANYTRDNQIYATELGDTSKNPTLTTTKLSQLHDQYIRTQTERMLKKSLFEQVQAGRIAELPEAFSDPKIIQQQQQLAKLQTDDAELKARFGPANPKVVEVRNQIEVLTRQIAGTRTALETKLKADYERAVQDERSLNSALNVSKQEAVNENQASIKYNILKQDVETARALYTDFLGKTNQAKAQVAEQNNSIKIIQAAQVPIKPEGPKSMLIILAGFILSLGAGIGLALFVEYLDDTIKSLEDVERFAQLPALGIIPKIPPVSSRLSLSRRNNQAIILHNGTNGNGGNKNKITRKYLSGKLKNQIILGEAYRALRTSIVLSPNEDLLKTILITSGQAGEGKTTTSVNTAISLAQLGAQVLIIDGDLRRPMVHKHLGIGNSVGVSTYLSGNLSLIDLIQELDIPNLSALSSGPVPPNPAELLSSQKMLDMLKILRDSYDYIIIDSPPIINVTDPIILSTLVDGTIMVIRAGKTSPDVVFRSRQELSVVRAKILGVVLNNVNMKRDAL